LSPTLSEALDLKLSGMANELRRCSREGRKL
jgi:hypothetical protein